MGDLESLLLILGLIYASECAVWVRLGGLAFSTWLGKRYRIRFSGGPAGNSRGAFIFAPPLPPLGKLFVSAPLPFSLSPEALFAYTSSALGPAGRPSQTADCLPFDQIKSIRHEAKKLMVNSQLFVKTNSIASARHYSKLLTTLQKTKKTQRADAITQAFVRSLDTKLIKQRLDDYQTHSKLLRLLSNLLFVYLFFCAPLVLWRFGFGNLALILLGLLLAQTISIALIFRRAHKALYPNGAEERFIPFFTMLLAPPTAIRAPDILGRHLLEEFHPLAVAQVLCPPDAFMEFARQVISDLQYPLPPVCPAEPSSGAAVETWTRAKWQELLAQFLRANGCSAEELCAPPTPLDPCNRSYCPRCRAQFTTAEGVCLDCGGQKLLPFSQGPVELPMKNSQVGHRS